MTDHKTVTDDVLANVGKITRKFADLVRRLTAKTRPLDPERTLHIMQIAADGTPAKRYSNQQIDYVLECSWAYDHGHEEFTTISVEECDREWLCFDRLLDPTLPTKQKDDALKYLKRIYEQIPSHGSHRMNRLYKITSQRFHGYSPGWGLRGTVTKGMVDMHMVLKPICEFDDNNNPVKCEIKSY